MGSDPQAKAKPYTLTEADKKLILASRASNIAALHFDGQLLVDMVEAERKAREARRAPFGSR